MSNPTNEVKPNRKLILLYSISQHETHRYAGHVANFMVLYTKLGYKFPLTPMPMVSMKVEEIERKYVNWFKKEKTYKRKEAVYFLEFPRELTEDELNAWRMFKLGFLCHTLRPVGQEA